MKLFCLRNIVLFLFILLATAIAARYISGYSYLAELFSHFTFHLAMGALGFATVFAYQKRWPWLIAAVAAFCISATPWLSLWAPPPPIEKSAVYEDITIAQFNIYYRNTHTSTFIRWINSLTTLNNNSRQPDILVIQEVTPAVADELKSLADLYPYFASYPENGGRGMAIYSKLPFATTERHSFSERAEFKHYLSNHFTVTKVFTPAKKIAFTLIELHTITPVMPLMAQQRNKEMTIIATIVKEIPDTHKILVGDMNITHYSHYFSKLIAESGLRNAMVGFGLKPTWRPFFVPTLLGIPIDHLLVSNRIEVLERTIGPSLGSDHLPVVSRLRIYQ